MRHSLVLTYGLVIITTLPLHADTVTVYNKTNERLFVRVYYQKTDSQPGTSAGPISMVEAQRHRKIQRPARKLYQTVPPRNYDRTLVAAHNAEALNDTLSAYEMRNFAKVNIGTLQGSSFYFATKNNVIKGFNKAEWAIAEPILSGARVLTGTVEKHTTNQLKSYIRSNYRASKNNPHKRDKSSVQIGNMLSKEEKNYLEQRQVTVKQALEQLLGTQLDKKYIPKIACVFSGGGHRAMISTIGSLIACQKLGLMNAITWNIGLSGSTWALGAWLVSTLPIEPFSQQLFSIVNKHITSIKPNESQLLANSLLVKWAYNQPITLVDIYGGLIANRLFSYKGSSRQRVYLSEQASTIDKQGFPLPIFTAIQTGSGDLTPRWYEFSPYQIGSSELGMYVEPWAFGRQFLKGESQDYAPEQNLGFLMGIFGSAFAAPYEQIYKEMVSGIKDKTTKKIMSWIIGGIQKIAGESVGQKRVKFSWAEVNNFSLGLRASPINNLKTIRFSDAGIAFNLPYPPVSGERPERKADIIILFDYSGGIHTASALHGVQEYAQRKKLPFPAIDYTNVTRRSFSVFKDEKNPATPVIIYIPLVRDESVWQQAKEMETLKPYAEVLGAFDPVTCTEKNFCSTTNFEYKKQQAYQLAAHNTFTLMAHRDRIIETIAWVIDKKS